MFIWNLENKNNVVSTDTKKKIIVFVFAFSSSEHWAIQAQVTSA